jgi:iron complex outermembrane receptor protein
MVSEIDRLNYVRRAARVCALAGLLTPAMSSAQSGTTPAPSGQAAGGVSTTVTVTAQKEPADIQTLPLSVTAVGKDVLDNAGITFISEAGSYAPNTIFTEFTARKLSNARFRGVGASPANPGITTFIDGVPQLNANSSSIELIDVQQVEFVRGSQSALFGRNTLGGLINLTSVRPSLKNWTGGVTVPIGNANLREALGGVSGPLSKSVAVGAAFGYDGRDGFTTNKITGHKLDSRSASFGKGQLLWTPSHQWETRVIVSGERARDGDYALNDLAALRQTPYVASRDFEGSTSRDIYSGTVLIRHEGQKVSFASTTGYVRWNTHDLTDLDYTPLPLVTRENTERDHQFTQEVRFASVAPAKASGSAAFRWQAGAFFMNQHYTQDAINTIAPFVISPFIPFAVESHSPQATLDDNGFAVYGQGTFSFNRKVDLTFGVRADHENKTAALNSFTDPPLGPPTVVNDKKSFTDASPQVALAFLLSPDAMLYVSSGRGFKAGGFNPTSPIGQESYEQEHAWHTEGGVKKSTSTGRLTVNAAVFIVEWYNMQVNLPDPQAQGFYISNAGDARTSGVEVEFGARPHKGVELFASAGSTDANFKAGSNSGGADVSGKTISNTPSFTTMAGTQLSHALNTSASLYARAEVVTTGGFQYDDANTEGQKAYTVANFRGGIRGKRVFIEAWMRNAFNTAYIPLAFSYQNFAPSGFIGEMGRPRTFGVRGGVTF